MNSFIVFALAFASIIAVSHSELVCDGKNQKLSKVTPVCPVTCDSLHKLHCLGLINKPSCQCIAGTVLDTKTKECVETAKCSTTESENYEQLLCDSVKEHYSKTTPACPATCANRHMLFRCLAIIDKPSCLCNSGLIRDTVNKKCVAPEQCP